MTLRADTCATCAWFKPGSDIYFSGGWCDWRPPMKLRGLLWGAHNERITDPAKEWCADHKRADGEAVSK